MVITTEILPCGALQSYIRCYTLRVFDTAGADFTKPLPANHEFTIAFTLSGSIAATDANDKAVISASRKHIIGLQTTFRGAIIFNGEVKLLTVYFRPNGFYRLFNLPADSTTDNIFKASDIINIDFETCSEQLSEAKDFITSL